MAKECMFNKGGVCKCKKEETEARMANQPSKQTKEFIKGIKSF